MQANLSQLSYVAFIQYEKKLKTHHMLITHKLKFKRETNTKMR